MYKFKYGNFSFDWKFEEAPVKTHSIIVEKDKPVIIRGEKLPPNELEKLIRKKARWIRDKTKSMAQLSDDDIVSGSRIKYLGRSYMAVVELSIEQKGAEVTFNARKFHIIVNSLAENRQELIQKAILKFQRKTALKKVYPRFKYWEEKTGLQGCGYRINYLKSTWGKCSIEGLVEVNSKCVELSFKLIDYIIVHELCHTVEMNHTKEFWDLVSEHYPQWEECHNGLKWDI